MNIMKQAIVAKAKAYSKKGNREKTKKRAAELREEIDLASKQARGSVWVDDRRRSVSA